MQQVWHFVVIDNHKGNVRKKTWDVIYTTYRGVSKINNVNGNLEDQMKLDLYIGEALNYTSVPWKPYLWA